MKVVCSAVIYMTRYAIVTIAFFHVAGIVGIPCDRIPITDGFSVRSLGAGGLWRHTSIEPIVFDALVPIHSCAYSHKIAPCLTVMKAPRIQAVVASTIALGNIIMVRPVETLLIALSFGNISIAGRLPAIIPSKTAAGMDFISGD